jgi:hypothetical protein
MSSRSEPRPVAASSPDRRDGIFISYRREDSAGHAGRLYDRLAARFGPERVFMDVDSIKPGADFVDSIDAAMARCRAAIVLIGPRWLTATDDQGRRRLERPDDFVRKEIEAALAQDMLVLPVLVQSADMPNAEQMLTSLQPLARHQAI